MAKQKTFFLIFLFLITGSINAFSQNALRTDFWLTLKDGTKIECTTFLPDVTAPTNGFPCIIYCPGFGKSKEDVIPSAESYGQLGYYTFTYSMRGQGFSSGQSNFISRVEMYDLFEIVNYIKNLDKVDKENVAIAGSSQGGIIPFMACCYGLDVKCIVADLTSPEFASNWIENGCIKMSLLWSLSYDELTVRYDAKVKKFRDWILSGKNDKWDSLSRYLPEGRDFMNKVQDNRTPSFFSNAWEDIYFNPNGLIKSSENFNNEFKLYIGAVRGHGSAFFGDEDIYHNESINAWLYKYLVSSDSYIDYSKYIFAYSSAPIVNTGWVYHQYKSDVSPFKGTVPFKLYFHPDNKLFETPNYDTKNPITFTNNVIDTSLTLNESVNVEFTGDSFSRRFVKNDINFDSQPLEFNYNMLGIPALHLVYSSDADVCQFNFQIWEVCSDGITKFVSSINYTDRKNIPGTIREKDIEGNAAGHIFSKGNKIRIILTNLDTRYGDYYLRSNPFVLPVIKKARNLVYIGFSGGSYLQLPLKESE